MAYQPTQFNEGAAPGLSAAEMNKLGSQYGEVKSELQKTDGTSDIKPHGSNLADGSVALAKLDPAAKTSPGGTEANRIAVTDASGKVGAAKQADNAATLAGYAPGAGPNQIVQRDANGNPPDHAEDPGTDGTLILGHQSQVSRPAGSPYAKVATYTPQVNSKTRYIRITANTYWSGSSAGGLGGYYLVVNGIQGPSHTMGNNTEYTDVFDVNVGAGSVIIIELWISGGANSTSYVNITHGNMAKRLAVVGGAV